MLRSPAPRTVIPYTDHNNSTYFRMRLCSFQYIIVSSAAQGPFVLIHNDSPWARFPILSHYHDFSTTRMAPYTCALLVLLLTGPNPYEPVHETVLRDILTEVRDTRSLRPQHISPPGLLNRSAFLHPDHHVASLLQVSAKIEASLSDSGLRDTLRRTSLHVHACS